MDQNARSISTADFQSRDNSKSGIPLEQRDAEHSTQHPTLSKPFQHWTTPGEMLPKVVRL